MNLLTEADFISFKIIAIVAGVLVLLLCAIVLFSGIKKCPPDKILVICGNLGRDENGNIRSVKCVYGAIVFVKPLIQKCFYLDLSPISVETELKKVAFGEKLLDISVVFTVSVSTEPAVMNNAAERLIGISTELIAVLTKDIICGQIRVMASESDGSEDPDAFLGKVAEKIEEEIKKIGLKLWSYNLKEFSVSEKEKTELRAD